MARRIEVELTSRRDDDTWTWRAAGAKQPRGVVPADLLPSGAKAGDVLRVDAEFDLDGITIINVLPPKGPRAEPERIQLIAPPEPPPRNYADEPAARGRGGPRREGRPGDRGPRRDGRPGDRGPRPGGPGARPGGGRDRRPGGDREGGPGGDRPGGERSGGPPRSGPGGGGGGGERPPARPRRERPAPPPPRPKAKKLRPGRVHRDAFLASLTPERRVVAEQLLKGGMPAVRTGLDEQNAAARSEGRPAVPTGPVLQIAEDLAPAARIAEWLDRAEAAAADLDTLDLRDLRSVVVSAEDVNRDERTRELATRLREALDRRAPLEQQEWLDDVRTSLEGGRVVRALRVASRPPTAGAALPADVAERLAEAAGAALTAEAGSERWLTVLDAVAYSPVRRSVVPAGTPTEPDEPLLALVRKHAGRVPAVAERFGVEAPAPAARSGGRRGSTRPGGPPPPRPAPAGPPVPGPGGRRIPPPPTALRPPPPAARTASPAPAPAPAEAKPHGDELAHLAGTTSAEPPTHAEADPTPEPAPAEAKPQGDELAHLADTGPAEAPREPAPAEAKLHGDELTHLSGTDAPEPPAPADAAPTPAPAEAKPHGDGLAHLVDPATAPAASPDEAPPAAPVVERAEEPAPAPEVTPEPAEPAPPPGEAKPHGDELEHLAAPTPATAPAPDAPVPSPGEAKPHGDELEHLAEPHPPPEDAAGS